MVRSITGEGRTIDEAIDAALAELNASRTDVNVEVIREPSTKLFGLKREPAVVRLTLKEQRKQAQHNVATVSIVGGELIYTAPADGQGVPALLQLGPELKVVYDGEMVEKEVLLERGLDPLEITLPKRKEPELTYELRINQERTKAELLWTRIPGVSYSLHDRAATNRLPLQLKETPIEPPSLTVEDAADIAEIEGLSYGLLLADLTPEVFEAPSGIVTLAVGKAPTQTKQPSIDYLFQEETPAVDLDALRIDYYEVHGIRGVKPGAILATKNLGQPGTPGIDVYGKPIGVEPLKPIEIKVGEGVTLSDDGLQAIATVSGLPTLQGGEVRVTSVFELQGDADASTGNITMDGNILINGNVLENIKIQSNTGEIVVNGLVSGALLRTDGSIRVLRNVVRSQLLAGGTTVVRIRFLAMLSRIELQLEELAAAYESIVSQAANIPFENLIKHLLELKFFQLPKDIKLFADYTSQVKAECAQEMQQLAQALATNFLGLGPPEILDIEGLKQLTSRVAAEVKKLKNMSLIEADVTVGYLQNSSIEASGQVQVTGKGSFYSTVLAGKGFAIAGGVFRGGEVTVNEGKITARELGGPTGIATSAQITTDGEIAINLVHPNVTVAIRDQSYRFSDNASQIRVFLEDGILTVYSGSNKIHG